MIPATKKDQPQPRPTHVIACIEESCGSNLIGVGATETKARHDANRAALDAGWALMRKNVWRCPVCTAAFVRADSERKVILRAEMQKAERRRIREAIGIVESRRKTRAVGAETAKADVTMNAQTQRLVNRNQFEQFIVPRIRSFPELVRAAQEFETLAEAAAGVTDREIFSERVDKGAAHFGPSQAQIDAQRALTAARGAVGAEMFKVAELAIIDDWLPEQIGARYKFATSTRMRKDMGMAIVKLSLIALAEHWGMA